MKIAQCLAGIAAVAVAGAAAAESVKLRGTFVAEAREVAMVRSIAVGRFDGRDGAVFALALERAIANGPPCFDLIASGRGLAGLAFADPGQEQAAFVDMTRRWPNATYVEDHAGTAALAQRVFDTKLWCADQPLRVILIGTDFEVRVWETLLRIPMGRATTYSDIAANINSPKASRAVGAAVGRNPVSFVVPCHRVIGKSGALTGYHWGLTRKQAMLGWEAGQVNAA